MKTGLLWFDPSGKSLGEKVAQAAARYKHKYDHAPDLCFVHPSVFNTDGLKGKEKAKVGEVEVRPGRSVLRHHFWIGESEK
jgi:hypothetical protein